MSLDLLKEFGPLSKDNSSAQWNALQDQHDEPVEEDDFGDFEKPEKAIHLATPQQQVEKHGPCSAEDYQGPLIDQTTGRPSPSPSGRQLNAPLKTAIPSEPTATAQEEIKDPDPTPVTAWPTHDRNRADSIGMPLPLSPHTDDEWGEFAGDVESSGIYLQSTHDLRPGELEKSKYQPNTTINLLDSVSNPSSHASETKPQQLETTEHVTTEAPPSNVPPPSILLSMIANIIQSLPTEIREIVSSSSIDLMNHRDAESISGFVELSSRVAFIRAAARIVAGRKFRWKRDTHLAQSMKIGPANSGKSGGMKLTGIDKTETRREDQEAAEVLRVWKQQAGSLKGYIAKFNAQQSQVEVVLPDFSENMLIRAAKIAEGGLTAPKCCFLCGLKREERVARLDVAVEDSFGEWWIDYWGHVDCVNFWEKHRDSLPQR